MSSPVPTATAIRSFASSSTGGRKITFSAASIGPARWRLRFARCRGYGSGTCSARRCRQTFASAFSRNSSATDCTSNTTCPSIFRPIRTCWAKLLRCMRSDGCSPLFPALGAGARWDARSSAVTCTHCVKEDGSYFEQSTLLPHLRARHVRVPRRAGRRSRLVSCIDSPTWPSFSLRLRMRAETCPSWETMMAGASSILMGSARASPEGLSLPLRSCWKSDTSPIRSRTLRKSLSGGWGRRAARSAGGDAFKLKSHVFQDSGVVVMRSQKVSALFDAGPFGPLSGGHSHSDTLSLVVANGDREVLIDSGTYSYMDPEWRELFRGSSAHNTIRIDGRDQAIPAGPFRWVQKPDVRRAGVHQQRGQRSRRRGLPLPGFFAPEDGAVHQRKRVRDHRRTRRSRRRTRHRAILAFRRKSARIYSGNLEHWRRCRVLRRRRLVGRRMAITLFRIERSGPCHRGSPANHVTGQASQPNSVFVPVSRSRNRGSRSYALMCASRWRRVFETRVAAL